MEPLEDELHVYRADLTCIARHPLLPRGAQRKSVLEGHRPGYADRGPELDQLRVAFAAMDARAAAFLGSLEKALPRSAGYHARQMLALRERWGTGELCVDLIDDLYAGLADGSYESRMKRWCCPALPPLARPSPPARNRKWITSIPLRKAPRPLVPM